MDLEGILAIDVAANLKNLLLVVDEQTDQAWGLKRDLRKLKKTLESFQVLISDAEVKQINDASVRLWLRRLKDIIYDADDVLDEICYETMRRRERRVQLKNKVCSFNINNLVFHFKIRVIQKRLDESYCGNATGGTSQVEQIREPLFRLTTSVVDHSKLIGREDASSNIVKMLTNNALPSVSPSSSSSDISSYQEKLSVVSIVGMGGLGKTSLAQLVYKDESIQEHFEQKIWVCVSENFDVNRILKQIIESTVVTSEDPSDINLLAKKVKEKLVGKKYLLVLDDLWNEDAEDWEKLKVFLVNGLEGSKILVTTRSQKVASVVGGKVHHLQKLTNDVCWSIMQKRISHPCGVVLTQSMTDIGREIAKKCHGLPLAAKYLGGLLRLKNTESNWVSIIDETNFWVWPETGLISILRLSYDNLASPLKQCFSYFSKFHRDQKIHREYLIRLWMAEGFIQLSDETNEMSMEDVCEDYF